MRVLLTGASGFIGSHFTEAILRTTDWTVVGLDRIDETSSLRRITDTFAFADHRNRFQFVWHDLRAPINPSIERELGGIDLVLHLAASTHVDRSIVDPPSFVLDNVLGTCHLLEWARRKHLAAFVNFSTDEAYGSAPDGVAFTEESPYRSGNPYAATKAGAVELGQAYWNTYGVPVITTHCMNVIGQRQAPEKFLPMLVRQILSDETVTIHADPSRTRPARRGYIHARNVWNAIEFLIGCDRGDLVIPAASTVFGQRFNIVGDRELDCLELATLVADILNLPLHYELVDFHSSRPGHDLAYRLDGSKLAKMGFSQPVTFERSLEQTVMWFRDNPTWL